MNYIHVAQVLASRQRRTADAGKSILHLLVYYNNIGVLQSRPIQLPARLHPIDLKAHLN
jgi:hypothetical protein